MSVQWGGSGASSEILSNRMHPIKLLPLLLYSALIGGLFLSYYFFIFPIFRLLSPFLCEWLPSVHHFEKTAMCLTVGANLIRRNGHGALSCHTCHYTRSGWECALRQGGPAHIPQLIICAVMRSQPTLYVTTVIYLPHWLSCEKLNRKQQDDSNPHVLVNYKLNDDLWYELECKKKGAK